MRNVNLAVLSGADNQNITGTQIDANQLVSSSFHVFFGDTQAAGMVKIQASNDPYNDRPMAVPSGFAATNWVDIPNQSATITSGGSALLTIANMAYRWIRALYTMTGTGAQTVTAIADTGVKQVQTVTTVADVTGSLNSTYFLLSSVNAVSKAQKNFYLWLDDGSGVDPAIAGRTGIHVTYSDNDAAAAIATAIRAALNALTNDFVASGASAAVIITNVAYGLVGLASDGVAATGFAFANTTPGVASNLSGKYFLLNRQGQPVPSGGAYYVWLNVDTISTDPAPAGKVAVAVAISSGATADTIGGALATAIAAVHSSGDFTASNSSGAVTVTNKTSGPFTPASDGTSGFAFAVTAGGSSTITVNMNALSM